MLKLPILEKNAYLSIVIKDNGLWSHLAYTDHNAQREYILTDFTDLNPLRNTLDDDFLTKQFWYKYFDSLEKVFDWDIVDRNAQETFTFRDFSEEGDGLRGIRINIDDNQKFFQKMYASLRSFSSDISLRVIDDRYMQGLLEALVEKTESEDLMYVDMDLHNYTIYRVKNVYDKKEKKNRFKFSKSKLGWKNERLLIESIRDPRFKAFMATEISQKDILNQWSNFVLNRVFHLEDPNTIDMVRSYSTIQNHSLFRDNEHKIGGFGSSKGKSLLVVSGHIPRVLGKKLSLLSLIDGLEITGVFDTYWDLDSKLLSFGRSYSKGSKSEDIVLTSKDMMSVYTKCLIPEVRKELPKGKIVFSGRLESLEHESNDFFGMSSEFSYTEFPYIQSKFVVEGEFQMGVKVGFNKDSKVGFVSRPDSFRYESILIDSRNKPVVYGPDSYSNKLKLQEWIK